MEKVKDERQSFSKAVISGCGSGSEKLVFEYYNKLVTIWWGSANTEPLPFGVSDGEFEGESEEEQPPEGFETFDNVEQSRTTVNTIDQGDETYLFTPPSAKQGKRKAVSAVPKLIDNKRKHLEQHSVTRFLSKKLKMMQSSEETWPKPCESQMNAFQIQ